MLKLHHNNHLTDMGFWAYFVWCFEPTLGFALDDFKTVEVFWYKTYAKMKSFWY
jgi:hypothetical protein